MSALRSIYQENFRPNLSDHFNPCRVYAYEDEAGLLVCSWPGGSEEPAMPVPYSEEVWTGLEYMLASHLIARGLVEEGLDHRARRPRAPRRLAAAIRITTSSAAVTMRARCPATRCSTRICGLTFDQRIGEIGFKPARDGDAVYFWSAGRGWGEIEFRGATATLSVKGGELAVSRLRLPLLSGRAEIDGRPTLREGEVILLDGPRVLRAGERIVIGAGRRGGA